MKICKFPTSYVKYQLPFSGEKAGNNAVSEALQEKRGTWGQNRKCKETWETLSIMVNGVLHYCTLYSQLAEVRIILIPLSFARLSALLINIVETSTILVRFLKLNFLKLISTTTVFLVTVMLKFHGIKGNNPFQLQHFFDKHMLFGCKSIER